MGVLGALLGAAVGIAVWVLLYQVTGWSLRYLRFLALGVGFLVGLGANRLSRKEGSKELGYLAVVFTLVGVFGAQYLVAKMQVRNVFTEVVNMAYDEQVRQARQAASAIPTGSDQEIRQFLAKEAAEDGEKPDPASVSADAIKTFREKTWPELQDLVSGKTSKAAFVQKLRAETFDEFEKTSGVQLFLFLRGLGVFNLGLIIVSAGLAYRMSANA